MFKQRFVLLFVFALMALIVRPVIANECWGWHGPVTPRADTGHIAISDLHTQGEHSLNFVIWYVEEDTTQPVYADFCKCFGGIELPDSLKWDITADTSISAPGTGVGLMIIYQDTIWLTHHWVGTASAPDWFTFCMDSIDFAQGELISPNHVYPHFPPANIDSLRFRIEGYDDPYWPKHDVFIFIDNFRFYYADQETLIDGMGDSLGIEESKFSASLGIFSVKAFPNPFQNQIKITLSNPNIKGIKDISIYDIAGRKVRSFIPEKRIIWKDNSPAGIYFLKVKTQKKSFTKKLIKLR